MFKIFSWLCGTYIDRNSTTTGFCLYVTVIITAALLNFSWLIYNAFPSTQIILLILICLPWTVMKKLFAENVEQKLEEASLDGTRRGFQLGRFHLLNFSKSQQRRKLTRISISPRNTVRCKPRWRTTLKNLVKTSPVSIKYVYGKFRTKTWEGRKSRSWLFRLQR